MDHRRVRKSGAVNRLRPDGPSATLVVCIGLREASVRSLRDRVAVTSVAAVWMGASSCQNLCHQGDAHSRMSSTSQLVTPLVPTRISLPFSSRLGTPPATSIVPMCQGRCGSPEVGKSMILYSLPSTTMHRRCPFCISPVPE